MWRWSSVTSWTSTSWRWSCSDWSRTPWRWPLTAALTRWWAAASKISQRYEAFLTWKLKSYIRLACPYSIFFLNASTFFKLFPLKRASRMPPRDKASVFWVRQLSCAAAPSASARKKHFKDTQLKIVSVLCLAIDNKITFLCDCIWMHQSSRFLSADSKAFVSILLKRKKW